MRDVHLRLLGSLVMLWCTGAGLASAQDYPNRPITLINGGTAGAATDTAARLMARIVGEKLGQSIVVENKPGGGGIIGIEAVKHAKPDGYTLGLGTPGPLGSYPLLYKRLSFDPLKDFIPVHALTEFLMILVVGPHQEFRNIADVISYARKNPEKLNYSTIGVGSGAHLVMEMLSQAADVKLTMVPYKGTSQQAADIISGVIDMTFEYPSAIMSMIFARGRYFLSQSQAASGWRTCPTCRPLKSRATPVSG